jgi:TM2 domain-containing membrane protein YozV
VRKHTTFPFNIVWFTPTISGFEPEKKHAHEKEKKMNVCSFCQSENPDEALFCNHCGARLVEEEASPEAEIHATPTSIPQPVPTYQPPPPVYYPARPAKDRSIALILEILPGLFGFLGFGWIYSGNTSTGILWLVLFLIWAVIALIISVVTGGIGLICILPVNIACIVASAVSLNNYTRKHPELFG